MPNPVGRAYTIEEHEKRERDLTVEVGIMAKELEDLKRRINIKRTKLSEVRRVIRNKKRGIAEREALAKELYGEN